MAVTFKDGGFLPSKDGWWLQEKIGGNITIKVPEFYSKPESTLLFEIVFVNDEGHEMRVPVMTDGTVHIDFDAFTVMMEALGYEKKAGYVD